MLKQNNLLNMRLWCKYMTNEVENLHSWGREHGDGETENGDCKDLQFALKKNSEVYR
jgi:hypothetical protein